MLFKLDQIVTFVGVAKHSSFSVTASMLNVTQPMITARIKKLENIVGFRLVHRTTKSVSITTDGAAFPEKCVAIVDGVGAAERLVASIGERAMPIRIGTLPVHGLRRW